MNEPEPSQQSTSNPPDEPDSPCGVCVVVDADADSENSPDAMWLQLQIERVVEALQLKSISLSVVIVADDVMATMHEQHCGVTGTTDVITFDLADCPSSDPESCGAADGELYVCLDEARRRASELGHETSHELLLYAIHGLLHLIGYDDHEDAAYEAMHAREDELLRSIGLRPLFRAGGRTS